MRFSNIEQLRPEKIMIKTSQKLFKKVKLNKKKQRNKEPKGIETLIHHSDRRASEGKSGETSVSKLEEKSIITKPEEQKSTLISAKESPLPVPQGSQSPV